MASVMAFMEYGKWKVLCPRCGNRVRVDMSTNRAVCITCYPGLMAQAFRPLSSGLLRPEPDIELRAQTLERAVQADEVYDVQYPDERGQIEVLLRVRPNRMNMNWYYPNHPTLLQLGKTVETVADLSAENEAHGLPAKELL